VILPRHRRTHDTHLPNAQTSPEVLYGQPPGKFGTYFRTFR